MTADTKQTESRLHKETGKSRLKRDEEDVIKVMEVVSGWCDPFEASEELVSLSSGHVASQRVKQDLLTAEQQGTDALTKFVEKKIAIRFHRFL